MRRGGLSFERPMPPPTSFGPPPVPPAVLNPPRRREYQHAPSREPFDMDAVLQPRELFDPHRNQAHAEWLKQQLKEVRGSSYPLGTMMVAAGMMVSFSAQALLAKGGFDAIGNQLAGLTWVVGTALLSAGAVELKRAWQRRKMGLSYKEYKNE